MKLFATKKEALITGAIAAFFVVIAIGFTFEPLATVIINSKTLPADTIISLKIPAQTDVAAIITDGEQILAGLGAPITVPQKIAEDFKIIAATISGEKTLNISPGSTGSWPYLFELSGKASLVAGSLNPLQIISARFSPVQNLVTLPDSTSYIEYVADPKYADPSKLPIILSLKQESGQIIYTTTKNSLNKSTFYLSPIGCYTTLNHTKVLYFAKISNSLIKDIFLDIPQYLANFSCYQHFSTFN